MLLLSGCGGGLTNISSGVCIGLEKPVEGLAEAVVAHGEDTPGEVVVASGRVVRGYDAGCR